MNHGEAFIVRFWQDKTWKHDRNWRGIVIHVPSGERIPVRSPSEALQVMYAYLSHRSHLHNANLSTGKGD